MAQKVRAYISIKLYLELKKTQKKLIAKRKLGRRVSKKRIDLATASDEVVKRLK